MNALFLLMVFLSVSAFSQQDTTETYTEEERIDLYFYFFADSIMTAVFEKNTACLDSMFDMDAFFEKILVEKPDDTFITTWNKEFSKSFASSFKFSNWLINSADLPYLDYVNHYIGIDEEIHIILRKYGDGMTYLDLQMEWINDQYKITDVYSFSSGETISETIKNNYSILMKEEIKRVFPESKFNSTGITLADFQNLNKIEELRTTGENEEAFDLFKNISPEAKNLKSFRMAKILVTAELEETKYLEAMTEYEQAFPEDPSLYLMALDKYFLMEDYEKALAYVNKLDVKVGIDVYLDFYRANIAVAQNDLDKAEKYLDNLIIEFPLVGEIYNQLIYVLDLGQKFEKQIQVLEKYVETFEVSLEDLFFALEKDDYQLVHSELYKTWKNSK